MRDGAAKRGASRRGALRADTTLSPVGRPEEEVYLWAMPRCCLRSLKEAAIAEVGERRRLEVSCPECGRGWWVTSSLDERVLERFVMHGGPRVGGSYPAA